MNAPNLISVSEAARLLSISRRSLERRMAEGLINRVKIGRRTLISAAELERFVRRQTEASR